MVGAIGIGAGTSVTADGHDIPVVIESVTPEQDLIVLRNESDSEVDISGYVIDWEHNGSQTQRDTLPSDATIEAGGTYRVASGYNDIEADHDFEYDAGRINNEDPDVVALLTPSEANVVATFDPVTGEAGSGDPVDGGDGGDSGDDGGDGDGGDGEDTDDDGETVEDGEEVDDDDSDDSDDDDSDDSDDDDSDDSDDDDSDGGDESAGDDTEDCPDCDEDHAADEDCPEEEPEPEPEEDDC